ncbi:MAG: hypothetical protein ACI8P0_002778 [Planctomycetaceae bacterium]
MGTAHHRFFALRMVGGAHPTATRIGRTMSDSPESTTPETNDDPDVDQSNDASVSFAEAAEEEQPGLVREFAEFLIESKAWWLTPIIIVLLLVGLLVVLSGSVVAPFIYPIF